ncbi:MAG: Fic family protein [Flavobacteriales bacterium]|nr:Fic family protein [Flavobacteriales bacterium]
MKIYETINKLRAELDSLLPMREGDKERLWKKIKLDLTFHSNHIEGNTLTYGETSILITHGKATGDHEMRDFEEVKAHVVALNSIRELADNPEQPFTESTIRELNKIILVEPFWKEAITADGQPTRKLISVGKYKSSPNSVRLANGEIFQYASPEETPALMEELMSFYKKHIDDNEVHPLQLAALFHHRFVQIHPFDDGNGRIARLAMNYILLKKGYPVVIIPSPDKKNYLLALSKADAGDADAFVEYIGKHLIRSLELSIKAAKGERIEELSDLDKEIEIWKREKVNAKDKLLTRTNVNIFNAYDNSLSPLIDLVIEELKNRFGDLFLKFYTSFLVNGRQLPGSENLRETLLMKVQRDVGRSAANANNVNEEAAWCQTIDISLRFDGYKSAKANAFNMGIELNVYFDQYKYSVGINRKHIVISKAYGEKISPEEMHEFLNIAKRTTFEDIKSNVESSN